jgi:hypothetical protein
VILVTVHQDLLDHVMSPVHSQHPPVSRQVGL